MDAKSSMQLQQRPKLYYVAVAAAAAAVEGNKEAFVQSDAKSARQVQSDPLNSSSCC